MDAYIYRADCYCEQCGEAIRERLTAEGKAPADVENEYTYDSDDFPKGPYSDGSGESDLIHHCGSNADCVNAIELSDGTKIGCLLMNDLTTDGVEWLKEHIRDDPDSEVVKLWIDNYASDYGIDVDKVKAETV